MEACRCTIALLLCHLLTSASGYQLFSGSSFLSALRGYGADSCRFISCPFGQYCFNGICQPSSAAGLGGLGYPGALGPGLAYSGLGGLGGLGGAGGLGAPFGGGLFGAANKLCAETVDCYSGQVCQAGRCTFATGFPGAAGLGYGGYGGNALGSYGLGGSGLGGLGYGYGGYGMGGYGLGSGYGLGGGYGLGSGYGLGGNLPYSPNAYGALSTYLDRPSGIQWCTLMQDCPNGQICVNGHCSQSNVAYGGSQLVKPLTTCTTGAVCPVGHFCIGGVCIQNTFSTTTACSLGSVCPNGMYCYFGRCQPNLFMGK